MEDLDVGQGELDRRERRPHQFGVLARPRRVPDDLAVVQVDEQADVVPSAADAHVGQVAAHADARRARRVYRLDPPVDRALAQVVLAHHVGPWLPGVYELDYLPLELVGEMPRVLRVGHGPLLDLATLSKVSNSV